MIGEPLDAIALWKEVFDVCNKFPGRSWVKRFLARHPELKKCRGSGLDPKRAKNFNRTNVEAHFRQLEQLVKGKNIPWSNVYNMDEKGIQLGGGRKGFSTKYFFSRHD